MRNPPPSIIGPPMKVLVVEDEKKVRSFIVQALSGEGMVCDEAATVEELLASLGSGGYDLVVLDRLLGSEDSLGSIPEIRRACPSAGILVLSALSEVDEKVRGLCQGADDYLGKPFHVSELIARLRALYRRGQTSEKGAKDTEISYGDLRIDLETQRVFRGESRIELTGKEFKILCLLARHPGRVFSKAKILDEVWDINHYPESNVVEVTIANLRAKIERGREPLIHSRRGAGYWLGEE